MNDYVAIALGVVCAGIGGELFVRAAVGMAHKVRIAPGVIGATMVAFATSSPELAVSVSAAIAGKSQIALGDALGSNVVNVALILALAVTISGVQSSRDSVKRDFPVAFLVPVVTGVLFLDGVLSRIDGLVLLGMFTTWLAMTIIDTQKQRSVGEEILGEQRVWLTIFLCVMGLALLVAGGHFFVAGAKGVALAFSIDEFIIGATIVAIGTSVPELATTVIAKLRGYDEVGLGTILGSNIFNGLFIVAIAAVISPIVVDWREVAVALVCGLLAVVLSFPPRNGFIERRRGVLLLVLYTVYLTIILQPKAGSYLGANDRQSGKSAHP